jgi:hypothetical protein
MITRRRMLAAVGAVEELTYPAVGRSSRACLAEADVGVRAVAKPLDPGFVSLGRGDRLPRKQRWSRPPR